MKNFLLLGAFLIFPTAQGKQLQVQCPARFPEDVVQLTDVPKGWDGQARVSGSVPLLGASYVEGPITRQSYGEIIGGGEVSTKEGFETRYNLDGKIREKWILCRYGRDGSIELFHRVPPDVTECVIRTKQAKLSDIPVVKITCK